jgi:ABC-type Mn2+/Zn2+ transport system permease subunit
VVLGTRVVGILLVTATLILPGAVAVLLARREGAIALISLTTALVAMTSVPPLFVLTFWR